MSIPYVDIFIVFLILYNAYKGYVYGFWVLIARFCVLVVSLIAAFMLYQSIGNFIETTFDLSATISYGIGFIGVLFFIQIIGNSIAHILISHIPKKIRENSVISIMGIIPGFVDGIITILIAAFIIVFAPVPNSIKDAVTSSYLGEKALSSLSLIESSINARFGDILNRVFATLTTHPESNEKVELSYKPTSTSVNPPAEARMLELLNSERIKVGVPALVVDPTIIPVARAHSLDMWQRQYFAHENPDGLSPAERMTQGGVTFLIAGENLALAQSVELAHKGLMNSPGHKRNILDPQFTRVGIGVIDGGIYGKMFTQNFAH